MTPDEMADHAHYEYLKTGESYSENRALYWVLRAIYAKLCEMEKKLP